MEYAKKKTPFNVHMEKKGLSMRDLSSYTGTNLSLVCYIVRGFAKFPTEQEFQKCCELLECRPEDLYSKRTLQVLYPKQEPKTPAKHRTRYGNPSVRVREDLIRRLKDAGVDVAPFVNDAVEQHIKRKLYSPSSEGVYKF